MLSVWVVASQRNKAHADGESRVGTSNQTLRGVGGDQKGKKHWLFTITNKLSFVEAILFFPVPPSKLKLSRIRIPRRAALGLGVPGHHREQLTQTLIVSLLRKLACFCYSKNWGSLGPPWPPLGERKLLSLSANCTLSWEYPRKKHHDHSYIVTVQVCCRIIINFTVMVPAL